jgi:hypothetical protein
MHKHTNWKTLKREQMSSQRLLVNFTKEDKINFNCAILFNTIFTLCTLFYRIGNGGNKLFVFVFVFVVNGANWPKLQPKKNSSRLNDKKQQKMFTFFRRIGEFYCILWA